jgi:hypothetical protein
MFVPVGWEVLAPAPTIVSVAVLLVTLPTALLILIWICDWLSAATVGAVVYVLEFVPTAAPFLYHW